MLCPSSSVGTVAFVETTVPSKHMVENNNGWGDVAYIGTLLLEVNKMLFSFFFYLNLQRFSRFILGHMYDHKGNEEKRYKTSILPAVLSN